MEELFDACGLRQIWVAEKLGVHKTLLNHWLRGRRKIPAPELVRLCELTGISKDAALAALAEREADR